MVWIFSQERGKITTIAKGAKKSKSKFLSPTLPLAYGEFVMFKGKSLYNLQEVKLLNSFQKLLDNLEKLTYSSYVCELVDISMQDEEPNEELYKDFITCLYLLDTDALDYELLIRAFELKVLKATGYGLNFDNCVICKRKLNSSDYINLSYYGGVCEDCEKTNGLKISKAAFSALRFLNKTSMDKVYRLSLNKDVKKEIEKINTSIIFSNYSKKPKSLEMLKFIEE